jgi:xanthine dehydrogenase small subunit
MPKATPMRDHLFFYLNGKPIELKGARAFDTLSSYLRVHAGLPGTKVVCAEGDCGACCVMVADPRKPNAGAFSSPFRLVNSCILPMALLDGCSVVTVEGMENPDGTLGEIQKQMVSCHGSQCGYCTPGFVMAICGMFEQGQLGKTPPDAQKVKNYLTGNLCRCTGYSPIIDAARAVNPAKVERLEKRYFTSKIRARLLQATRKSFEIRHEDAVAHGPSTSREVSRLLSKHPGLRIVSSSTDLGVVHNKEKIDLYRLLTLHRVTELHALKTSGGMISVGAKVDLETLRRCIKKSIPEFSRFLNLFASPPIRNTATLVGNIANGSPIADTLPALFVLEAQIEVAGAKGSRKIPITQLYSGYRKLRLRPGEWIRRVLIPVPKKGDSIRLYKVSQRKDLDISTVNAAFYITRKGARILRARAAYGGVGPTTLRVPTLEKVLKGEFTTILQAPAETAIANAVTPLTDVRASDLYRKQLCVQLFRKFCAEERLG